MDAEALSPVIEIAFVALGLAILAWGWLQQPPAGEAPGATPRATRGELALTAVALGCAAVPANILVLALTPGMPMMPFWVRTALVPALMVLPLTLLIAYWLGYERLTNRIWVGTWVGFGATAVLDIIRLTGFNLGLMPGNMPRMFGTLILDTMAVGPSPQSDLVGYAYHVVVGASFGLTYTLLVGRAPWWGGLIWGLLVEVGMMTTPPMVVAMDTGLFAWKMPGTLVVSLLAHVAFGIVLGLLCARYIRYRGHVVVLAREALEFAGTAGRPEIFGQEGTNDSPSGSSKHSGNRIEWL